MSLAAAPRRAQQMPGAVRGALLAAWLAALAGCSALAPPAPVPPPAASPPPAVATAPSGAPVIREAERRYDASGRLIGVDSAAADTGMLITPGEAAVSSETLGVRVEVVVAPAELKTLLERHLDVVRLGRLARDDVEEGEWARLIDAAPAQVMELLRTEGHFAPTVELERQPRRAAGEPDVVRLVVNPGPRARIARVRLEAEGELERAALAGDRLAVDTLAAWRAAWTLPVGANFRNPAWSEAKAAAQARLRAAGYATAVFTGTSADVDPARNEVRLFLSIDSGPLFRLGSLEVEGLVTHDADTVRHLSAARQGTPVTEALLLDFQERLQKAGLFESITVTLDNDPTSADAARVLVRLREAPLQVWTFGVGVSANTGPRASAEHLYRRVFGFAATARNKVELGTKRQAWDGEISTHPGEGLYRNLLGGAVTREETDSDIVLSQRVRLGRTQDTTRIERLYFLEGERSLRRTNVARTSTVAMSVNYHGVWRDVDSVVLPTEGFTFAGQAGFGRSHGTGAITGWFTRAYGRLTGYLPLGASWYGQARIELGQVFLREGVAVPESQRFRAGGDDSVRGYGFKSLGPSVNGVVGGGEVLLTSSIELARPFSASLPSVWGAVFVDAGNAADSFAALKPVLGAGLGVRWRSPVGPLRLDLAYGEQLKRWRLHFSVGIAF
jgi:translocation and assembly module TamA